MIATTRRLLVGATVLYIASQALPVTRLVYWPSQAWIEGADVTVERYFPLEWVTAPRLSYVEIVHPLTQGHNGGQVCRDEAGPFRYSGGETLGRWNIEDWAAPCLDDPQGYRWSAEWTWHLGALTFGLRAAVPDDVLGIAGAALFVVIVLARIVDQQEGEG